MQKARDAEARSTRSGAEFSPYIFNNATHHIVNHIRLQDLLVRHANSLETKDDDASIHGSDDDEADAEADQPAIFTR
ncbi:hypothetical protein B0H13DRAFT_2362892 [Mycena leptocephala]|nr:hypothetical protein B0H13DRAFT_2362892 [Mycena leptocephala]